MLTNEEIIMKSLNRIFIVGHPGAGKAYFARCVAEALNYEFVDADLGLEAALGLPLQDILGENGVEHYQETQLKVIEELLTRAGIVVAMDGYVDKEEALQEALSNEFVIYLKTSVETQLRRSIRNQPSLLDKYSLEQLYTILQNERNEVYASICSLIIDADEGEIDVHVQKVQDYISENKLELELPVNLTDKDTLFFKQGTDIPVRLSPQQAICFKHMVQGLSSKEISNEMHVSHRTIEGYIAQMKEKLGCTSSKELIALYHGNG